MISDAKTTYPPLNTLKPVAEDVWIVDGPAIGFGFPWPKMPFPTRMTIIRLPGGDLFVHSPTPLVPGLGSAVDALGRVRWIVGPNRIHYCWLPDWREAYPAAEIYLAPRIVEQAGGRIRFHARRLDHPAGYPWDGAIATLAVPGRYMTEFEFFHWPSRTLVLTDLIENFEPARLGSRWLRLLMRLGGVQDPDGSMSRDLRWTFRRHRGELRRAVETMIGWDPERIVIAHGRWYEADGAAELRRAFRWLLKPG